MDRLNSFDSVDPLKEHMDVYSNYIPPMPEAFMSFYYLTRKQFFLAADSNFKEYNIYPSKNHNGVYSRVFRLVSGTIIVDYRISVSIAKIREDVNIFYSKGPNRKAITYLFPEIPIWLIQNICNYLNVPFFTEDNMEFLYKEYWNTGTISEKENDIGLPKITIEENGIRMKITSIKDFPYNEIFGLMPEPVLKALIVRLTNIYNKGKV